MADGPRHVLIAGPTASGKSDLATQVACRIGASVVNADSQQVYRDWQILTARPSPLEMQGVPHALYGHVDLGEDYSVGRWLAELRPELAAPCVIVGGTGLYFRALTRGLAEIPPIPDDVRAETAALLEERGLDALVARLTAADPQTAAQIDLANPRRVLRAWEVLEATGVGLAAWQAETPPPLLAPGSYSSVALVPERSWLYARCEARFDQMMAEGALEEARAVRTKTAAGRVDLKAVGANELIAYLAGDLSWGAAVKQAKMETRRYAKRQLTWIRNQMSDWPRIDPAAFAHVADGIAPEADRLLRFD